MYKRTKIEAEVHPRFLCLEEFMNYTGLGRGSAMKLGNDDLIVRIPENEAEGELWSYEM